jgi:hypothetical protein
MPRGLRNALRLGLLVVTPLAAACASPLDSLMGTSADQLASQAFANLDAAKVTHLVGGFQNGGRRFALDCTTDHAGDAQGTISVDGRPFDVLVTGGRTFVRGQGFWAAYGDDKVTRFYGESWVALQVGTAGSLAGLASPCTIGQTLRDRRFQLKKGASSRIRGQDVIELSDSSGRMYVTSGKPTQLVRVVSSSSYRTPDGSSDVHLDFDHPRQLQVAPPPVFVDPSDPRTFPAHYAAESVKIGKCDASGCAVSATVRNFAGPPAGKSTATFKVRGADDAELGSCTVDLPAIDYQQAQDVSCTVGGSGWANFYNNSTDRRYFARVSIQNPPYDG